MDGWTGRIIDNAILRYTQGITEVAFSPSKTHFISACKSDTIGFSDVIPSSPEDTPSPGGYSNITKSMAFSPDGMWMVSLHPFGDSVVNSINCFDKQLNTG
jgi:hypothetical protein